jgi:hypothetical protein
VRNHIFSAGSDEQRRRYVPRLATGEWIGCWSLTEPEAGSDAAGTRTSAVREGDGWVLNGAKTFTTNAHEADVCVAMAVTDRAAAQHGISAFIFDRGTPGFRLGRKENKLGMRASSTGEVIFENCLAALSVGTAQGAYDVAFKYSRQRRQFGRHISEFQAIQFKLADMAASVDAARLLALRAGYLKDQGRRVTKESAIAKLFASETAVQVAEQAVQVLGGYGLIKDYRVEKFYRDVKLCTIGEGTSEIQRLVIARQLLKD